MGAQGHKEMPPEFLAFMNAPKPPPDPPLTLPEYLDQLGEMAREQGCSPWQTLTGEKLHKLLKWYREARNTVDSPLFQPGDRVHLTYLPRGEVYLTVLTPEGQERGGLAHRPPEHELLPAEATVSFEVTHWERVTRDIVVAYGRLKENLRALESSQSGTAQA